MPGETSEAVTECEALQRDQLTATLLGAGQAQARRLARSYWLLVYPQMPDDYRTGDCAPGGRLDEGLDSVGDIYRNFLNRISLGHKPRQNRASDRPTTFGLGIEN